MDVEMDRRSLLRVAGMAMGVGLVGVSSALALADPAHAAAPRLGTITIPRIKLKKTVYSGIEASVLKLGIGHGKWSAQPGTAGHVQLFGHRTIHGGPFRNLHKLRAGDAITVGGLTYRVRRIDVISVNEPKRIWAYEGGGARLSLVACSKPNGKPTSQAYRICVRASA